MLLYVIHVSQRDGCDSVGARPGAAKELALSEVDGLCLPSPKSMKAGRGVGASPAVANQPALLATSKSCEDGSESRMGCVRPIAVATSLCDVFPARHAACNVKHWPRLPGAADVCSFAVTSPEWSEWDE
jgi:hypothetical protein